MFFLSIRVLICPRSLFNCFICASILLFHHGFIPVLFLFLTPNMSLTTAAPAYTQSFSSVIFPNLVLSITSTNFLVASNNLCFSIPLSGGNLSLVSFNKTLYIFSSMLVSSIVISYSFLLQKHGFFPPQHLPVLNLTAISLQDVILLINQPLPCYIKHFHFISYAMHSLPVSISPILTFVVALHCNSFLFLEPFSSRCPPISSNSMMTRPILLTNGTPSRRRTFT